MAAKEDYRIFVGGLSWNVTERQLEDAFDRFGKGSIILAALFLSTLLCLLLPIVVSLLKTSVKQALANTSGSAIMLERDTGRPRGFGFITFSDRRGMEDAIREMHGRELGDRVISVNKAQPKMGGDDDLDSGFRGGYSAGGRRSYGGGDRSVGQDDCFKCGRPGHWARDCPSAGGGRGGGSFSSHSRFGGGGGRGDRFGGDRDRYVDDRYDAGRYGERCRFDSRDSKYGSRDRHTSDRYQPADRFPNDRYTGGDRYPQNGYDKDRNFDGDGGPRGSDKYGSGGAARNEGRSYRSRAGPYDRTSRGGRPSSFDRF
ncbi:hypothetical protein G4B88_015609 [Cannabis sativa]|uniref:Uncharacterized protein n=1 Tax=Cannabis sativa TaxID=3483 RepID=A0A7J6H8C8_CANSA|nr:hypothetical protein G4B88_015609 [Cannabis sativa]